MTTAPTRQQNQTAYRNLKAMIDQTYHRGRFVAISGGGIVADAATFPALTAALAILGINVQETLIVQAGTDFPETADILAQLVEAL